MAIFIPIETPNGTIWAEVDETPETGSLTLTSPKAHRSFQEAVMVMKENAKNILSTLHELGPEEVEIAFGVKVGAEGGIPLFGLAKASGESSYSVKLTWKGKKPD